MWRNIRYSIDGERFRAEMQDFLNHLLRHGTGPTHFDIVEARHMKSGGGIERPELGRPVTSGASIPDGNHMGEYFLPSRRPGH